MTWYPAAPQSVSRLLDAGFGLYRHVLRPVLPLSALVALVAQVPQLLQHQLVGATAAGDLAPLLVVLVPGIVAWLVLYLASYNGLLQALDALARDQPAPTPAGALRSGLARALPAFGAGLLYVLAMIVGLVLLVVPGLIVMISLVYAWFLVVLDGRGPLEGLAGSHRLVWGNWWRTAGVLTIAGVIYSVPVAVISGVVGVMAAMIGMRGGDVQQAVAAMTLPLVLVQIVASTLLLPMLLSMMLVLFRDLQLRKSGSDLAARAEAA
jgi:hypothetical protein